MWRCWKVEKYITIAFDDGPREPMIQMIDKFKKFSLENEDEAIFIEK